MKLTQSQRADLLAQFMAARASASRITSEVVDDAKEMLEAYEAELATWPEPPPAAYGTIAQQMAEGFRSDVPVPLTDEQVKSLVKLPNSMKPIRNPEEIDFTDHPIPKGYTVASYEDCRGEVQEDWMVCTASSGWIKMNSPLQFRAALDEYTYLRPLREDEK